LTKKIKVRHNLKKRREKSIKKEKRFFFLIWAAKTKINNYFNLDLGGLQPMSDFLDFLFTRFFGLEPDPKNKLKLN
jgi:hypothetical protein